MKAKGIYMYGVWTTYNDGTQDWRWAFYIHKTSAEGVARSVRAFSGVVKAVVKRVYIAPPKGAAQ